MTTLTDFLLARIAEDEAVARAAFDPAYGTDALGHWVVVNIPYEGSWVRDPDYDGAVGDASDEEWAIHATRHDPARVLAECAAKRKIMAEIQATFSLAHVTTSGSIRLGLEHGLEAIIRLLGEPYADHPDYRQEWA